MTTSIHQEIVLNTHPKRIYEIFMDNKEHSEFTGAPAEINQAVGGSFSCHGGQILGRHIELIPNKRIVQAWRVGAWDEGVYSIVKIELEEQGSGTRLTMDHSGFPEGNREHLDNGWHARYWKPLKEYLS